MLAKLFTMFTLVTLLETYLLYVFGANLGAAWTLALIVFTAFLGAFLTKREGLKIWNAWRESLSVGKMPEEGIVSGVLVLVGAVLLVTPGVLTDVTGIALLVPVSRRFVGKYVGRYLKKKFEGGGTVTQRVRVDNGDGTYSERVETRFGGFGGLGGMGLGGRGGRDPNIIDAESEVIEERRRNEPKARLESSE